MNTLIYLHIVISIISRAYMETEEILFVINHISCVVEQFSIEYRKKSGILSFFALFRLHGNCSTISTNQIKN